MKRNNIRKTSSLGTVFLILTALLLSQNLAFSESAVQVRGQQGEAVIPGQENSISHDDLNFDGIVDYKPFNYSTVIPDEVPVITDTGDIVHTVPAPATRCQGLTYDGSYLWVSDYQTELIYKVSPVNGAVLGSFPEPSGCVEGLAWDGTYLWASANGGSGLTPDTIYQVDPSNGVVIHSFVSPVSWTHGITWDGQYLWLNDFDTHMIYKVDPANGHVLHSFPAPGLSSVGLTWDGQYLWSDDFSADSLYQIDPSDGAIIRMVRSPHTNPRDMAWDGQYVWVLSWVSTTIYQVDVGTVGSITNDNVCPEIFTLYENYPNPFNPSTTIRYAIRESGLIQLSVYDELGRLVRILVNEEKQSGVYSIIWDGTNGNGVKVSNGLYFYQLKAGSFDQTRSMLLLK